MSESQYKYSIHMQSSFKKALKKIAHDQKKKSLLAETVKLLGNGETLPESYHDHTLTGNFVNHRECHILPDFLLIYRYFNEILVLELCHIGTHSELFRK